MIFFFGGLARESSGSYFCRAFEGGTVCREAAIPPDGAGYIDLVAHGNLEYDDGEFDPGSG